MDKSYIAPQMTVRETIAAGMYVTLDTLFLLFFVGLPALATNLFSPSFPRRWKLGNAMALLLPFALLSAIVALVVYLN